MRYDARDDGIVAEVRRRWKGYARGWEEGSAVEGVAAEVRRVENDGCV